MGERLRSILLILNLKTLIVAALAIASTYLCRRFDLVADFPLTLIATAVVFPIVFSISGAYKRRENALDEYGSIKAHSRAIFFATRDWVEGVDPKTLETASTLLGGLMKACRKMFAGTLDAMSENERAVYAQFSKLSGFIKDDLRGAGLASGEVSRCNQYLSKMVGLLTKTSSTSISIGRHAL